MKIKIFKQSTPEKVDGDCHIQVINTIVQATTENQTLNLLKTFTPLPFDYVVKLYEWIHVLNQLDSILETTIRRNLRNWLIGDYSAFASPDSESKDNNSDLITEGKSTANESDMDDVKTILKFTSNLLRQSDGKELYNSMEHILNLLNAFDDELAMLAFDCFESLALSSDSHRTVDFTNTHHSILEKHTSYSIVCFDIIESCYYQSPVQTVLSESFTFPRSSLELEINGRTLLKRNLYNSCLLSFESAKKAIKADEEFFKHTTIKLDVESKATYQEMMSVIPSHLSLDIKRYILWSLRIRRLLLANNRESKLSMLKLLFQASFVVLSSYPLPSILYKFFQNKVDMLKDCVYMLKTGPIVSTEGSVEMIPLQLRVLAVKCIQSVVESRNRSAPIFVRYPWLMHDLGVNRGQYMGLMPCVIRSCTSYLLGIFNNPNAIFSDEEIEQVSQNIYWIEQIFSLLLSLVAVTSALPALSDNGLMSSLLSIIKIHKCTENFPLMPSKLTNVFIYTDVLLLEILENVITNHSNSINIFQESGGLESIFQRLNHYLHVSIQPRIEISTECANAMSVHQEKSKIQPKDNVLILQLLSVLSAYLQESRGNDSMMTSSNQPFYRTKDFQESMSLIIRYAKELDFNAIYSVIMLVSDVINRDPAPPTILSYLISSTSIIKDILLVVQDIFMQDELPIAVLCFLAAISLTSDGSDLVLAHEPFTKIFSHFHDPKCYFPKSKNFMVAMPSRIGSSIEELLRHYPQYSTVCLTALVKEMRHILSSVGFSKHSSIPIVESKEEDEENMIEEKESEVFSSTAFIVFERDRNAQMQLDDSFVFHLHCATAIITCVEQLLTKKPVVKQCLDLGLFECLLQYFRMALGPPRYLIASFTSMLDSSVEGVGFFPLRPLIKKCIFAMSEHESALIMHHIAQEISPLVDCFHQCVRDYWREVGQPDKNTIDGMLTNLSIAPLQDYYQLNTTSIPVGFVEFSKVIRTLSRLAFLCELFGNTLRFRHGSAKTNWSSLISFQRAESLQQLIEEVYVPIQEEMARARGGFITHISPHLQTHPIYHLLVVAPTVFVRDKLDENSTTTSARVMKYPRGARIEAFERRVAMTTSGPIVKYRVEEGWISPHRPVNHLDMQTIVIDISAKTAAQSEEERSKYAKNYVTLKQKLEFEKLANVSLRRGGYLAFFHFHHFFKLNILQSIMKASLLAKLYLNADNTAQLNPYVSTEEQTQAYHYVRYMLPSIISIFERLLTTSLNTDLQTGEENFDLMQYLEVHKIHAIPLMDPMQSHVAIHKSFFQQKKTPSLKSFSAQDLHLAMKALELLSATLFDSKRGKPELNSFLMTQLWRNPALFSTMLRRTVDIFLCCADNFESVQESEADVFKANFEADEGTILPNDWLSIRARWLQDESQFDCGADCCSISSASEVNSETVLVYYLFKLRERKLLALTAFDGILDFWKSIYQAIGTSTAWREKFEAKTAQDEEMTIAKKRMVAILLTKYLALIWTHPSLGKVFPSVTIKSILDLMSVAIRSMHELHHTFKESSSSSRSRSSQYRITPVSRPSMMQIDRFNPVSNPPVATQFQVSNETISSLQDMGFERNLIVTAARRIQSNVAEEVVQYLLENPLLEPDPLEPPSRAANTVVEPNANDAQQSADTNNQSSNSSNQSNDENVSPNVDSMEIVEIPKPISPFAGWNATKLPSNDQVYNADEQRQIGNFTSRLSSYLHSLSITVCLDAIEEGNGRLSHFYECELLLPSPVDHRRESFTISVLNSLLKIYDKYRMKESAFRLTQLSWIYQRLRTISQELEVALNKENESLDQRDKLLHRLRGLLQSVVLLATNRIISENRSMASAHANAIDLIFLVLRMNPEVLAVHERLLKCMRRCRIFESMNTVIQKSSAENSDEQSSEESAVGWLSGMFLIADIVSQNISLDKDTLRSLLDEYRNMHNMFSGRLEEINSDQLTSSNNSNNNSSWKKPIPFISKELVTYLVNQLNVRVSANLITLTEAVDTTISGDNSEGKSTFLSTMAKFFAPEGLKSEMRMEVVDSACEVIKACAISTTSAANTMVKQVLQATMQCLIHLLRGDAERLRFLSHDCTQNLIELRHNADELQSLIFTLLQRVIEDEKCTKHQMLSTTKLIYDRIMNASVGKEVTVKRLLELTTPLIQRDYRLFFEVLEENFEFHDQQLDRWIVIAKKPEVTEKEQVERSTESIERTTLQKKRSLSEDESNQLERGFKKAKLPVERSATKESETTNECLKICLDIALPQIEASTDAEKPMIVESPSKADNAKVMRVLSIKQVAVVVINQIIGRWLELKEVLKSPSKSQENVSSNTMSLTALFYLCGDFVATVPLMSHFLHRFQITESNILQKIHPEHEIGPISFSKLLLHYMLSTLLSADAAVKEDPAVVTSGKIRGTRIGDLVGEDLRDAVRYFISALLARPGNIRKQVLQLFYSIPDKPKKTESPSANEEYLIRCRNFADLLVLLIQLRVHRTVRDTFIFPASEIAREMTIMRFGEKLAQCYVHIDFSHPEAQDTLSMIANAMVVLSKKSELYLETRTLSNKDKPESAAATGETVSNSSTSAASSSAENTSAVVQHQANHSESSTSSSISQSRALERQTTDEPLLLDSLLASNTNNSIMDMHTHLLVPDIDIIQQAEMAASLATHYLDDPEHDRMRSVHTVLSGDEQEEEDEDGDEFDLEEEEEMDEDQDDRHGDEHDHHGDDEDDDEDDDGHDEDLIGGEEEDEDDIVPRHNLLNDDDDDDDDGDDEDDHHHDDDDEDDDHDDRHGHDHDDDDEHEHEHEHDEEDGEDGMEMEIEEDFEPRELDDEVDDERDHEDHEEHDDHSGEEEFDAVEDGNQANEHEEENEDEDSYGEDNVEDNEDMSENDAAVLMQREDHQDQADPSENYDEDQDINGEEHLAEQMEPLEDHEAFLAREHDSAEIDDEEGDVDEEIDANAMEDDIVAVADLLGGRGPNHFLERIRRRIDARMSQGVTRGARRRSSSGGNNNNNLEMITTSGPLNDVLNATTLIYASGFGPGAGNRVQRAENNGNLDDEVVDLPREFGWLPGMRSSASSLEMPGNQIGEIQLRVEDGANAGSFTLHFGRGGASTMLPGSARTVDYAANATVLQPPTHPLISLSAVMRRSTMINDHFGGAMVFRNGRDMPYLLYDPNNRVVRNLASTRRKDMGPLVSDRRWGTDVGELDYIGSRLDSLVKNVQTALKSGEEGKKSGDASSLEKARFAPWAQLKELQMHDPQNLPRSLFNLFTEHLSSRPSTMPSTQESENRSESPVFSSRPRHALATRARRLPAPTIHSVSNPSTATSSASIATRDPVEPTVSHVQSTPSITAATNAAPSAENLEFIESLPAELRQEVLLSSEQGFLQTLPAHIQEEAANLRIAHGLPEIQVPTETNPAELATAASSTNAMEVTDPPVTDNNNNNNNTTNNNTNTSENTLSDNNSNNNASDTITENATTTDNNNNNNSANNNTTSSSIPSSKPAEKSTTPKVNFDSITLPINDRTEVETISFLSPAVIVRTCMLIIDDTYSNEKLLKPMQRLLVSICSVKLYRRAILRMVLAIMRRDVGRIRQVAATLMQEWQKSVQRADFTRQQTEFDQECESLCASVQRQTEMFQSASAGENRRANLINKKLFWALTYMVKKTENLAWYELLVRPSDNAATDWLFGELVEVLGSLRNGALIDLESGLQLTEDLITPLHKLSVAEANYLVKSAKLQEEAELSDVADSHGLSGSKHSHETAEISAGENENHGNAPKRRRLSIGNNDQVVGVLPIWSSAESNTNDATNNTNNQPSNISSEDNDRASLLQYLRKKASTPLTRAERNKVRKLIPMPVLNQRQAKIFAEIISNVDCSNIARKKLMRILRFLSLCDSNWQFLLEELSQTAMSLVQKSFWYFQNILEELHLGKRANETATQMVSRLNAYHQRMSSSSGQQLPFVEVQLLNVLRLLTLLRSKSHSTNIEQEMNTVASYMRRVAAERLWRVLCECMDIVRSVEGIRDEEHSLSAEDDAFGDAQSPRTRTGGRVSTSGAVRPIRRASRGHHNSSGAGHPAKLKENSPHKQLSALMMRFIPLIECFLTMCGSILSARPSKTQKTCATPSNTSTLAGQELIRVNSHLPGSRFRQTSSYEQMELQVLEEDGESDEDDDEDVSSLATVCDAEELFQTKRQKIARALVRFAERNQQILNVVLRNNIHLLETSFAPIVTIPKCRAFLHFDIKRAFFKVKLKRLKQQAARASGGMTYSNYLRISVRRSGVFEESFQSLRHKTADEMRRRLVVTFHGEEGMDAGGLTREWYSVLAREIFNENYALFSSTGDKVTFQPNAHSYVNPDHLSYFKFVGRIIGKAICDGHLLDAHFTRSFYKHMLGLPVSVHDLEAIEPEYYKSLQQILETPLDLLGLDLTFSADCDEFGKVTVVDLLPNGREIPVTDENKHEYVKLLAHHRMTSAIRKQIDAFLEGFHDIVPPELISLFDAQELELLISGLPDIDLDDLRANTEYHGYKAGDPIVNNFWKVLRSFSKEEKALFLQFVTGTSKVPLDGFKALQGSDGIKRFNIHKAYSGTNALPTAHTCFNQLDLPEYSNEEELREKLLTAIREGSEGFGFA